MSVNRHEVLSFRCYNSSLLSTDLGLAYNQGIEARAKRMLLAEESTYGNPGAVFARLENILALLSTPVPIFLGVASRNTRALATADGGLAGLRDLCNLLFVVCDWKEPTSRIQLAK